MAFGLPIPWLGFYQDDWHHLYYYTHEGALGLRRFLFFDSRPFAFIVYEPLFKLLGIHPLGWHIAVLILRLLTVLAFLGVINLLWSRSPRENALVALLFLIYPAFLLQPMSVMFSLHWGMYLACMLSLWAMLKSVGSPRFFVGYTLIALLLQMFHLLMIEYYVGLEFLRPLLLFIFFRDLSGRERIKAVLKAWLPYLLIAAVYILFRTSFGGLFGYDRNAPTVVFGLFTHPFSTAAALFQTGLQDFVSILLSAWYETLKPALFDFSRPANLFVWLVTLACMGGCWWFFMSLRIEEPAADDQAQDARARQMLVIGLFAVLAGLLPGWAVGKTIYTSNSLWDDRFALAAMFGAAMVLGGVIHLLVQSPTRRHIVLGVLIALAVGANLRTAVSYKSSWEKQLNFYWQLTWRAPYVASGTAFISDSEFLYFMGVYPTSFAINTLYPKTSRPPSVDYWLYTSGEHVRNWNQFRAGMHLTLTKYASTFEGSSTNSLAIDFEPEKSQCLWILRPADSLNRSLTPLALEFIPVSNVGRIRPAAPAPWSPPEPIFGREPAHNWCYYFEQADLARQNADWSQVIRLWESAQKAGLAPDSGVEYIPFIEAYAHTGGWKTAGQLTLLADRITEHMDWLLCATWQAMDKPPVSTPPYEEVILTLQPKLQCDLR